MPSETPAITPWIEPPNWARLPIIESGEPLVPIPVGPPSGIRIHPLYYEAGMPGATPEIRLRSGVVDRLKVAAAALAPHGLALVVFDGYRPLSVQQHLHDTCAADIRRAQPHLTDDELIAAVRHFVAAPNADPTCPPPHRTGGAVDVYLVDAVTGAEILMGTAADEAVAASATRAFEDAVDPNAQHFRDNRRRLFHAMTGAGFTNYYNEWWHFDYGNQRWANVALSANAFYGIPLDEK